MDSEVEQLHSRAESLFANFGQGLGGGTSCINEAIELDREALELCSPGHPMRSDSLICLAIHLGHRYNQHGVTTDLDEAIVLEREALKLRPEGPGHHDASTQTLLNNLAVHLSTRYNQLGANQDLNEAIVHTREVLDFRPKGHPNRPTSLNNLAVQLSTRYNQLGAIKDVDEAIVLNREALNLRPHGHLDRWMSLINLAMNLSTRHQELAELQDLDEAIVLGREALNLQPQGYPGRSTALNNLAVDLSTRYQQLGAIQDLDQSIILVREALDLRPQGHPGRSSSLNNLALHLSARYKQLYTMDDLNEAIVHDREALGLRPQGHPDRSMSLNNLSNCLFSRYMGLRAVGDLDESIVLVREALCLRPQGHPLRLHSLNNCATRLFARYRQHREMEDLDEAIVLDREVLELLPRGHPDWSESLHNQAYYLCIRFTRSGQLGDKEEVFSRYAQLVHVPQILSFNHLSHSKAWVRAAEYFQHPTLLLAYETSLKLLVQHLATLPSLPRHLVIFKKFASSLAVDAFSACLRKRAPANAVELLEQGRVVFWSQLTRLHFPLHSVIASGQKGRNLAEEFTQMSSLINNALNSSGDDQHDRLCHLNSEMQKVVTNIRELPGLSRFLLPSLFLDLRCAASGGPVIIVNASQYSCDALVVLLDHDPVHIPLPRITQESGRELSNELHTLTVHATKVDVTRELAAFLRKLWDQIVSPIVDFLQTIHPSRSRIWWCPTAEFSGLPLHAAGPYRKGQRNLLDLYISSYTPTLTALIRARQRNPSNYIAERKRFLAIGQAKAVGRSELPAVGAELDNIGHRVEGLAIFTRIDGVESCTSRVIEEFGKNEWVHLACHGLPNRKDPLESAFALHDGRLTIQRITSCDFRNPEFAYLSACHTTVGDEESPDEVIHLASAMQVAGFRSVIGTMWAVDDGETNKITSTFYKHMVDDSGRLDYTRAAFALNKTMRSVNIPFDQRVLYIHLGS